MKVDVYRNSSFLYMSDLDALVEGGFVQKQKIGRGNYYINVALTPILQGAK